MIPPRDIKMLVSCRPGDGGLPNFSDCPRVRSQKRLMKTAKLPKVCLNGIRQHGSLDHCQGSGVDPSQAERVGE